MWMVTYICITCVDYVYFRPSFPMSICMGPQIFQKSNSHLQILGARRMIWSKFCTEELTCEPQCYPLSFTQCKWKDTQFYMYKEKKCNNYTKNIIWHHKKFSCLDDQMTHDVCASVPVICYSCNITSLPSDPQYLGLLRISTGLLILS
jgi:hypothetical protein